MNGKQLLLVLAVLAALVAGGWGVMKWQRGSYEAVDARVGQKLLPGFKVDEVATITIAEPGATLTLVRTDQGWTVKERGGYPASVEAIRDLLVKLEALKVAQAEGISDALRPRLQLAAPGGTAKPEETATGLELKTRDGKPIATLLLGKKATKQVNLPGLAGESIPSGRYVLVASDPQRMNVVAEPFSAVVAKPQQWLARDYLKVERIKSLAVLGPDGKERWSVMRPDEAAGWSWSAPGKLDGGKAQDGASALSSMQIADAAAGVSEADAGLDRPVTARAQTFDGWSYDLRIGKAAPEDRYYVKAAVSGTVPEKRTPRADEKAEDKEKEEKAFAERQAALKAKLEREQALGAFTVLLPKSTVDPLLRDRSALVVVEKKDAKKEAKGKK
jgi:Domain of unknown function (DUF4340)